MKQLVALFAVITLTRGNDLTQIERNNNNNLEMTMYHLEVPGKEPITVIEENTKQLQGPEWTQLVTIPKHESTQENEYTTEDRSRCYGPSCRDYDFNSEVIENPSDHIEEIITNYDRLFGKPPSKDQIAAIGELASNIKNSKYKNEKHSGIVQTGELSEDKSSVATAWNRLKIKKHKHPYDDNDGWVTMEAVPWTTSKISKWKPNKKKPNHWDDDSQSDNSFLEPQNDDFRKPSIKRPSYVNNRPNYANDWTSETPKPWNSGFASYSSSWSDDDSRRPTKPNCDNDKHSITPSVYYGLSDSVITDARPNYFPYEALKRPIQRPTQVVYSGFANDRISSHPFEGDGQWVLLSTTKGYHPGKKRQRSLTFDSKQTNEDNELIFHHDDQPAQDSSIIKAHKVVSLTVLPTDNKNTNMTTSHGGLLEVERSFQTVEESKKETDDRKTNSNIEPLMTATTNKIVKRKVFSNSPDSSTVLAAVGAGMLPATMGIVVPMMLGRRRRDLIASQSYPSRLQLSYKGHLRY